MANQIHTYEPQSTTDTTIRPDIVAFYPFTYNGNHANSGERLQRVANSAGTLPRAAAPLLTVMQPGWHSDLMDHQKVTANLMTTHTLLDA